MSRGEPRSAFPLSGSPQAPTLAQGHGGLRTPNRLRAGEQRGLGALRVPTVTGEERAERTGQPVRGTG